MGRQATSLLLALLAAVTVTAACRGDDRPLPIERDVFIATYVDLRLAVLESDGLELLPEQREEVLTRHGVDEQALLYFADYHGRDVDFMNDVWAEAESRVEDLRPEDDGA